MFKKKKDKDLTVECWNLDYYLIKWINEHIKVFVKDCNIDLDEEKFISKGKETPFKEILERLIDITDILLNNGEYIYNLNDDIPTIKAVSELKDEMYDLLKLVHWQLWW